MEKDKKDILPTKDPGFTKMSPEILRAGPPMPRKQTMPESLLQEAFSSKPSESIKPPAYVPSSLYEDLQKLPSFITEER